MPRDPRPIFLERRNYRRRRMMDALRLVAILGALLWLMPIIWPNGRDAGTEAMPMSVALYYIFGVWLLLIALAATLAAMLRTARAPQTDPDAPEGQDR